MIAVNSINWARIMAQIVYYVASAVALGAPHREVSFTVPSANFGNLFAGYMAKRMGLPVKQFVIATNANDILLGAVGLREYADVSAPGGTTDAPYCCACRRPDV